MDLNIIHLCIGTPNISAPSRKRRPSGETCHAGGDCARTVCESNVSVHWVWLRAKSRFPKLLKALETKIVDGAIRENSGSLQAGVTGSIPVTSTNLTNARMLGASTTVCAT